MFPKTKQQVRRYSQYIQHSSIRVEMHIHINDAFDRMTHSTIDSQHIAAQ